MGLRRIIRAVIFDLDGVLVDTAKPAHMAANAALRRFGRPEMSFEDFMRRAWGRYSGDIFKDLVGDLGDEMAKEAMELYNRMRWEFIGEAGLYPWTLGVLEALKARGLRLAITTHTVPGLAEGILGRFGIAKYFDAIVRGGDAPRPKPSPDPILLACGRIGVGPEEAVYVGDNVVDVLAGKAAGCITVALTTSRGREEFEEAGADFILDRLDELPALIDGLGEGAIEGSQG
ncbi:MAG: HAD family hydrolase [Candidatus Bathyarchaeia archaeon]